MTSAISAVALAVTVLGGCSDDGAPSSDPRGSGSPGVAGGSGRASGVEIPADLGQAFTRLLDQRAAALLARDRVAFAEGLAQRDEAFLTEQATYFDNMRQLPVSELSYQLDRRSLVRSGDHYWVVVQMAFALDGFDAAPVVTLDRFRFSPVGAEARQFVLSSVTDAAWERRNEVWSQPWDDGPIEVRDGVGVLGIFDPGSVRAAGRLIRSVERGISDVGAIVPYDWSHSVVVYALSDPDFLSSIEDPPGGDTERLDAVAFPVATGPDGDEVASTRFALHPQLLNQPGFERDRLVRHELTHVAIGERDDHAPVWLSEGLAEYVSVRSMAPEDRQVADAAIAAAKGGLVTDLPDDETFNDEDSAVHYGVAWWACEYLAATFGAAILWTILDELEAVGAEAESEADGKTDGEARLESMTGISSRRLARNAAKLLIATFDPDADPTPGGQTASAQP